MDTAMTKQYVCVQIEFTPEGRMLPRALKWIDDETIRIDRIKQIRSASASETGDGTDRYTIIINGQEQYLYFENDPDRRSPLIGRWYVEIPDYDATPEWG